jgi:hypothetical protein
MGAAFAGVFCGVLVLFLLDCGTFMAAADSGRGRGGWV